MDNKLLSRIIAETGAKIKDIDFDEVKQIWIITYPDKEAEFNFLADVLEFLDKSNITG